jgi:hypothetical protein
MEDGEIIPSLLNSPLLNFSTTWRQGDRENGDIISQLHTLHLSILNPQPSTSQLSTSIVSLASLSLLS